jgi:putative transposase
VNNSCAFFVAHEAAGAASTRSSLRPLISRGTSFLQRLGRVAPRECERTCVGCLKFESESVGWAKRSVPTILRALSAGMPNYRRAKIKGGSFFFTVALADRSSKLLTEEVDRLRQAYRVVQERRPFETIAICILPDHIHAVWALPDQDPDFATRWNLIKGGFSRGIDARSRSQSKVSKREKGIWQRRYWEHAIRDEADLERHVDYIHFNPVKHGHVTRVADWPHSSFHRYVERGILAPDWGGDLKDIVGAFGE